MVKTTRARKRRWPESPAFQVAQVRQTSRCSGTHPPQLREAFADPLSYFRRVADRCPFPTMALWLRSLIPGDEWELVLHRGVPPVPEDWTAAGIRWWSDEVRSAEITPASCLASPALPPALRQYDL